MLTVQFSLSSAIVNAQLDRRSHNWISKQERERDKLGVCCFGDRGVRIMSAVSR